MGATNTKRWGKSLSILQNKNFASFWVATFAYYTGVHMETLAYGWLVYGLTKSIFLLGLATAISTIPDFLSIPGGFIADRVKKKSILYIVQAVMGINALVMAVLLSADIIEYQYIILLSMIHTMAMRFAMPARLSFISEIVSKDEFMGAYSLYYVASNIMRVTAPVMAGVIASTVNVAGVYFVIGLCHLSFIVLFHATHVLETINPRLEVSVRRDFMELLSFARYNTTILMLLGLGCGVVLFSLSATTLNPVFAADVLDVGAVGLGLLGSAQGIGNLVGSIFSVSISHSKRKTLLLLSSGVVRGVLLILFASSRVFYISLFFLALGGIANGIHTVSRSALFQLCSPNGMRGRVTILYEVTSELRPIGTLAIAIIAQNINAPFAVGLFGLIWAVICVAVIILRPSFRRLELE